MIDTTHGVASDRGVREVNEDSVLAHWPVFAVADGVGGHAGGAEASSAVVSALAKIAQAERLEDVQNALDEARFAVEHLGFRGKAPGSTASGLVLSDTDPARAFIFNVGDSRTYLLRARSLLQVTKDHSFVQELVDEGVMSSDEARVSGRRNIITRAIGAGSPDRRVDYFEVSVAIGDRFLVCTDGVCGTLPPNQIREILENSTDAEAAARALVAAALAAGSLDNASAVVVDIVGVSPVSEAGVA
ncbi:protein phosphatase [Arcanobacterium wilhelmae]|uniref:Protein phosphatase n=1 Tax=Arcanobacterium wilhelmae TaxID=1803177 RepID=A0ABT9NAR9_9ACTO|nr:protein phosphatase 2C domain-containing protein [Arcanobacterium wilhelmae]MDP9800813.1 protein phosphatase [Arcanobacterium wilhelmae]WFN90189.1 protein phosphatase 2C domain-containing protein [Arcanobacterium wilhelmae]